MTKLIDDFSRLNKLRIENGLKIKGYSSPSIYIAQKQLKNKLIEIIHNADINKLTIEHRINFTFLDRNINKIAKIVNLELLNALYIELDDDNNLVSVVMKIKKYKGKTNDNY